MDQWCLNAFLDGNIIEEILRVPSQFITIYNKMPQSNAHAAIFHDEYETKTAKALARRLHHSIAIPKNYHVYKTVHDNYHVLIDAAAVISSHSLRREPLHSPLSSSSMSFSIILPISLT